MQNEAGLRIVGGTDCGDKPEGKCRSHDRITQSEIASVPLEAVNWYLKDLIEMDGRSDRYRQVLGYLTDSF